MTGEEKALQFPCAFPIKAMGKSGDAFEAAVLEIMNRHVPDLGEGAVASRPSDKGNYTAITVTIHATSQEQLDAIYRELSAHEAVLMAL